MLLAASAAASAALRRNRRGFSSRPPRRHHAPAPHRSSQPPPRPPQPQPPPPPLPPGVLRGVTDAMMKLAVAGTEQASAALGRAAADAAAQFWPSGVPRSLPPWVYARLHWAPEAWSPCPARWLPAEWTARPSQKVRIAILDALWETQAGAQCVRLAPALVARALSPPGAPAALAVPPRPAAAAMMLSGGGGGPLGSLGPAKPPGVLSKGLAKVAAAVVAGLRLLEATARAAWLACLFAPLAWSARASFAQNPGPQRTAWADSLRSKLERAGPAFIKWGQWAATRLDLFPPDLCSSLERLHAAAPAHPRRHTVATVRSALGVESLDELFEGFPDQPLASGSIGQVYRARLSASGAARARLPPGTVVAVKVRHPGVGHAVARDFGIMMTAAALATSLVPSLREARLDETLRQFEAPLREQVDLSREAYHLWQFVFNFRDRPDVRFPQPVFPLVAPSVLVETFEEGGPIGDHVSAGPAGKHGAALAAIGSAAVLRMLLCDNLVHADLHPGNILVRLDPPPFLPSSVGEGGSGGLAVTQPLRALGCAALRLLGIDPPRSWLRPSLVLLDVGMTTSLGPGDRETMVALFTAFARGDGRGVAEQALRFSEACGERQRCPDPEAFRGAMGAYFEDLDRERALAALPGGTPTDGGKALAGVLELIRQHRVSLPGHICAVLVTTLVLEGWSSRLDPSHSPIAQVEALLAPEKNTAFGRMVTRWDEARESLDPRCDVW